MRALAACVYFLAHATIDWIWTLPACGIVFFSLLGLAASGDRAGRPAASRVAVAGAVGQ